MDEQPVLAESNSPFDLQTYSSRLRFAMTLRNPQWQQAELAREIGCEKAAINALLQGRSEMLNATNSARAAQALAVDHYWLATGEGSPQLSQQAVAVHPRAAYVASRINALKDDQLRETTYAIIVQILALAATARTPE